MTRTVYPTVPPRVEYELTDLGRTLRKPIQTLAKWAQENREQIQDGQESLRRQIIPGFTVAHQEVGFHEAPV